jgi:hypothetical protein
VLVEAALCAHSPARSMLTPAWGWAPCMSRETSVDNGELLRRHGLQVTARRPALLRAVSDPPHGTTEDIDKAVPAELGAISCQAGVRPPRHPHREGLLRCIQRAGSPARPECVAATSVSCDG